MRRDLEPVSPAPLQEQPDVITIEDTPNPLGDEPSFEIVDSVTQEEDVVPAEITIEDEGPERPQSPERPQ